MGLRDAEGIQKNETQRALNASLSYSHRDVDFDDRPSKAVSNDVARGLPPVPLISPFNFAASETAAHRRSYRNGVKCFLQVEQETCEETAAATCLVVRVGESLEHVFQDGYCISRATSRRASQIGMGLQPVQLLAQVNELMLLPKPCRCG